MAEYIEREKAIEHIETHLPYRCSEDFIEGQKDCVEQLKSLPASDVVEVVHSKWIKRNNERRCPICDFFYMTNGTTVYNLCPMCGAKMDGERRSE